MISFVAEEVALKICQLDVKVYIPYRRHGIEHETNRTLAEAVIVADVERHQSKQNKQRNERTHLYSSSGIKTCNISLSPLLQRNQLLCTRGVNCYAAIEVCLCSTHLDGNAESLQHLPAS